MNPNAVPHIAAFDPLTVRRSGASRRDSSMLRLCGHGWRLGFGVQRKSVSFNISAKTKSPAVANKDEALKNLVAKLHSFFSRQIESGDVRNGVGVQLLLSLPAPEALSPSFTSCFCGVRCEQTLQRGRVPQTSLRAVGQK